MRNQFFIFCTETYLGPCQISIIDIGGALRDLKPFVQFKKRQKYPWRSVMYRP